MFNHVIPTLVLFEKGGHGENNTAQDDFSFVPYREFIEIKTMSSLLKGGGTKGVEDTGKLHNVQYFS